MAIGNYPPRLYVRASLIPDGPNEELPVYDTLSLYRYCFPACLELHARATTKHIRTIYIYILSMILKKGA